MTEENIEDNIWLCSIDIGKKNFAFYVEEVSLEHLSKIKNISKEQKYNTNGTPTQEMIEILDKVYINGKTILHENCDITQNCATNKKLDPETFYNMTDLLDKYTDYWDKCSYFIIEEQMKINQMACKLGQHCYSYFAINYGRSKNVIEYPSRYKTQVLGCEKIKGKQFKNGNYRWKTVSKPLRKKWSIKKATEILEKRGEKSVLDNIQTKSKKDDLADTLTQLQSFKYLYFVDNSFG